MLPKRLVIAIYTLIFIAGLVAAALGARRSYAVLCERLAKGALHNTVAFPSYELAPLAGAPSDAGTPQFRRIQGNLAAARASHPAIGYMSLLRFFPDSGRVVCLAASGPESDAARIPGPGESRDNTADADAARQLASGATSTVMNIFHREWKNAYWISGYALCDGADTPPPGGARAHIDIFRYDINGAYWFFRIGESVLVCLLAVWLLPGLPFAAWLLGMRHKRRGRQILQFSEAIEQSDTAIMIVRVRDSSVKYVNPSLCKVSGYTREELAGQHWRMLRHMEPPAEVIARRDAMLREGIPIETEWEFRRKDNTVFPVSVTITPVRYETETIVDILLVFADITEHRRQADLLKQEKEKAEHDNYNNALFIATTNNEVRKPIDTIDALSAKLASMPLNPEQSEYAAIIRKSSLALKRLTHDLADFSRFEAGLISIEPVPADPRQITREVLDLVRAQAAERGIALLHDVADDVPRNILVPADRLRQILLNLASNAIKFTKSGEVEIRLKPLALCAPGNAQPGVVASIEKNKSEGHIMLMFSVRDTGIGISPADHEKLFIPFWQLDSGNTRQYGGVGLGLPITRHLVQKLGGEITVDSEPGRGSTFHFTIACTIPRKQQTEAAAP